jgi:hypothetical protein
MNGLINLKELKKKAPRIYQILDSYYNVKYKRNDKEYWHQEGIKNVLSMIDKKIVDETYLKVHWQNTICKQIANDLNVEVKDATMGMVPNYGGIIELGEDENGLHVELHFYVSFLENVYSIQIVFLRDDMTIKRNEPYLDDFVTKGVERLVVSPHTGIYFNEYKTIEAIIESNFENAIFLPFSIEQIKIENLEVTYQDKKNSTVGEAFFHKAMPINFSSETIPNIIGDENYKIN